MNKKLKYNELSAAFTRALRVFIATGVAEVALVHPDWSNPEAAVKVVAVAFVSGLISGIFKYLRDEEIISQRLPL